MTHMADVGPWLRMCSWQPSPGEWLTLRFLRRLAHMARFPTVTGDASETGVGLARAAESFCSFLAAARQGGGVREPRLAHPGSPVVTKDERRLLRALAAAGANDEVLLDNFIYKFALNALRRVQLAQAIRALARALAAQEHLLAISEAPKFMASFAAFEADGRGSGGRCRTAGIE